ncbi:MAG: hypothetical protein COW54_06545 [Rhodobacteraceae bacterium CG17_big_fil_post_rev_8_21_14_2_50_63_15]|nr:hypothetical protein [Roseovarius sp.]PIV78988.1 MAG: hypothetical protein COW54_06545 [Rhodobacteraceae bacterium CG17_big_fil_post_rev_8_21_14_2_50_63_15]
MSDFSPTDLLEELLHLQTPLDEPGSGRVRYGAAMALWRAGRLSEAQLEVYREAAAHDERDPSKMLKARGLPIVVDGSDDYTIAIKSLAAAAETYLLALSHPGQEDVRRGLARRGSTPQSITPLSNPVVTRWLDAALSAIASPHLALAKAIADAAPHLRWVSYGAYPRDLIGDSFAEGHAFASLIGKGAPYDMPDFKLGLFIIAPHVLYRDHMHPAAELYAPLTGPHGWRFGIDQPRQIKPAHEPVWNPSNQPHLTRTGSTPFLAFYVWTSDVHAVAHVLPAKDWPELEKWHI